MKFNYQARTKAGVIKSGIVEASNKEIASELLKEHGLFVTALEEAVVPVYALNLKIFDRVSKKDVMLFSRQLSIMFKAKVPLIEVFETLAKQTSKANFREKILNISEKIEGGMSLSKAFSYHPKLFSSFYVNMVKSGETSGKLTDVFLYLADYLEREDYLRQKIRGAMMYPAFIILVFVVVIAIIVTFVIPQLSEFLKQTGQELPWITRVVMAVSDFARTKGWLIILGIIGLAVGFYFFMRSRTGKSMYDRYILKIPFIGSFFKKFFLTRFALNLSTLISGGLPITQALKITGDVVGNEVYKEVINELAERVKKGERMSYVLEKHPDIISPLFSQMVVVGEKTGTVDTSLNNIVEFYQRDVDTVTDNFIKLIEPILIITLGLLVAGLAIAVLLPIYSFTAF